MGDSKKKASEPFGIAIGIEWGRNRRALSNKK